MAASMRKKRVLIVCGGQSSEHEVSLSSAANIVRAMNFDRFDVSVIGIDKAGVWHALSTETLLDHHGLGGVADKKTLASHLSIEMGNHLELIQAEFALPSLQAIDVVFPVLHGPNGEDGTIQGLLKLAKIPFVGSDVLGSAVSMDKDVMKRLARDAGLPIADFLVYYRYQMEDIVFEEVVAKVGLPFFIKPCNLGSSVGVHKVHDASEWLYALQDAFCYEAKIIIEQAIVCRELECGVLGNQHPNASVVGEIIPHHEFYSYEAKYLDQKGASLAIPAEIPDTVRQIVQRLAIQAFQVLNCAGLARVDFFLDADHNIYFNEINTLPGFTSSSMYPMLWQASGLDYATLIETLIDLALERGNNTH